MRGVNLVLGVGLGIVWVVAQREALASWLTWADLCLALVAIGGATTRAGEGLRTFDLGLGIALVALWLAGLATFVASWLAWWNFAFGVAFLIVGVGAAGIEAEIGRDSIPSRPSHV